MKKTGMCPKCGSTEVARFDGNVGPYGSGNNLQVGKTIFSAINVNRYICLSCGFTEEWIDDGDLAQVAGSKKIKR